MKIASLITRTHDHTHLETPLSVNKSNFSIHVNTCYRLLQGGETPYYTMRPKINSHANEFTGSYEVRTHPSSGIHRYFPSSSEMEGEISRATENCDMWHGIFERIEVSLCRDLHITKFRTYSSSLLRWSKSFGTSFIKYVYKKSSLFIKIEIVTFKVLAIDANQALMPAFDPVFDTFLILDFRYDHQGRIRFFQDLLSGAVTCSAERFLESTEWEKVAGSQSGEFSSCSIIGVRGGGEGAWNPPEILKLDRKSSSTSESTLLSLVTSCLLAAHSLQRPPPAVFRSVYTDSSWKGPITFHCCWTNSIRIASKIESQPPAVHTHPHLTEKTNYELLCDVSKM